jgi:hypothetical protein
MITMDGKYKTRDGDNVRVICIDCVQSHYPVVALVGDFESRIERYSSDGMHRMSEPCGLDLTPVPEPPKYIPFDDSDRDKLRGAWIRCKANGFEFAINAFSPGTAHSYQWEYLFRDYEYLNGEPFGKLA